MAKYQARTFSDYKEFQNYIQSLDPLYSNIINISKPNQFEFGGEYKIVVEINSPEELYNKDIEV